MAVSDTLWLSAFVKATSAEDAEDFFQFVLCNLFRTDLTDNLLQYCCKRPTLQMATVHVVVDSIVTLQTIYLLL